MWKILLAILIVAIIIVTIKYQQGKKKSDRFTKPHTTLSPQVTPKTEVKQQELSQEKSREIAEETKKSEEKVIKPEPPKQVPSSVPAPAPVSQTTEERPQPLQKPKQIEAIDLRIKAFALPKNEEPFFNGDEETVRKQMQTTLDLSDMTTYLTQSKNEHAEALLRTLNSYQRRLQKTYDKFDFNDYDEEEFSEEITQKYFNILHRYCLNNLLPTIYRGYPQDSEFYADFLRLLNAYLTKCHVYTRLVLPGEKLNDADYDDMQLIRKPTEETEQDGLIDEVEKLPYYMSYMDVSGDVDVLKQDGNMIVLQGPKES